MITVIQVIWNRLLHFLKALYSGFTKIVLLAWSTTTFAAKQAKKKQDWHFKTMPSTHSQGLSEGTGAAEQKQVVMELFLMLDSQKLQTLALNIMYWSKERTFVTQNTSSTSTSWNYFRATMCGIAVMPRYIHSWLGSNIMMCTLPYPGTVAIERTIPKCTLMTWTELCCSTNLNRAKLIMWLPYNVIDISLICQTEWVKVRCWGNEEYGARKNCSIVQLQSLVHFTRTWLGGQARIREWESSINCITYSFKVLLQLTNITCVHNGVFKVQGTSWDPP